MFPTTPIISFMMHTFILHLHRVFYYFDSSLHKIFGCLLGPGSFDSPERPLIRKQTSFLITFGGVRFILTTTIALIAYLRSWTLVILIIIVRFMINQHPFLLETLTWIDNNTFLFQQCLKVTCDLLPPPTHASLPPFE